MDKIIAVMQFLGCSTVQPYVDMDVEGEDRTYTASYEWLIKHWSVERTATLNLVDGKYCIFFDDLGPKPGRLETTSKVEATQALVKYFDLEDLLLSRRPMPVPVFDEVFAIAERAYDMRRSVH